MKKKLLIILTIIAVIMTLFTTLVANASDGTVALKQSASQAKKGDTINITIHAKSADGINGIVGTYSYDKENLEFVSAKTSNSNWVNLADDAKLDSTIEIMTTKSDITDADIYILTFKVKNTATIGANAKISTSQITLSTFGEDKTISEQETSIKIIGDSQSGDNNQGDNNQGSNNQGGNSQGSNNQGDNNQGSNNNNNQNVTNSTNNNISNNKISSINANKDNSTISKNTVLPKAGETMLTIISVIAIILILVAVYAYVQYKKYNKYSK